MCIRDRPRRLPAFFCSSRQNREYQMQTCISYRDLSFVLWFGFVLFSVSSYRIFSRLTRRNVGLPPPYSSSPATRCRPRYACIPPMTVLTSYPFSASRFPSAMLAAQMCIRDRKKNSRGTKKRCAETKKFRKRGFLLYFSIRAMFCRKSPAGDGIFFSKRCV